MVIGYKVLLRGFVVFDIFSGGIRVFLGIRRVVCSFGFVFVDILCYYFLLVV